MPGQVQDLVQGRDLVLAVVRGVVRAELRQPLLRPQGPQLGQGEVLGEPAGQADAVDSLGGSAVGELGLLGTSVVPLISFSWRTTSTPSLVLTTSGSMTSAHCRMASSYDGQRVLWPVATRAAVADHGRADGESPGGGRQVDHDHLGVVGRTGVAGGVPG